MVKTILIKHILREHIPELKIIKEKQYLKMKNKSNLLYLIIGISIGFIAAYLIEKRSKATIGAFTAMAIASVLFGLVHYHAGSIVYISLASIAGWAYGYTYYKTRNVFYSALVHTLVNNTFLIIGIELLK